MRETPPPPAQPNGGSQDSRGPEGSPRPGPNAKIPAPSGKFKKSSPLPAQTRTPYWLGTRGPQKPQDWGGYWLGTRGPKKPQDWGGGEAARSHRRLLGAPPNPDWPCPLSAPVKFQGAGVDPARLSGGPGAPGPTFHRDPPLGPGQPIQLPALERPLGAGGTWGTGQGALSIAGGKGRGLPSPPGPGSWGPQGAAGIGLGAPVQILQAHGGRVLGSWGCVPKALPGISSGAAQRAGGHMQAEDRVGEGTSEWEAPSTTLVRLQGRPPSRVHKAPTLLCWRSLNR